MCPLCSPSGENVIFSNELFRVILVDEIPGFIRIIANRHIKELSDLNYEEFTLFSKATFTIEKTLIEVINPDKVNIASLGNYVPHLHIHIIPRYKNDAWWPDSIWSPKLRNFEYPEVNLEKLISEIKSKLEQII